MKNSTFLRRLATLSFVGFVGACSSVNPAGLLAASRLDPLSTPPDALSFAVSVPRTMRLEDGDAELRMSFAGRSAAAPVQLEEVARLQIRPADQSGPRDVEQGDHVFIAKISPTDAAAIAALQAEIRDLRARGIDGEGSLSIKVAGGCYIGNVPQQIHVGSWIRAGASDEFVQITRRTDILKFMEPKDAELLRRSMKPCAT